MSDPHHSSIVQREYDGRAHAYLQSAVHAEGADLAFMAEQVGQRPEAVVLDMGCGGGHVSFRLAPCVAQVVAYDLAPRMLQVVSEEAARRGLSNIVTRQGAAESLPESSASFDVVVTRYSAHHWGDMAAGLRQMHRVLKPGGLALFADLLSPAHPLCDTWLQSMELLRDSTHVRNARMDEWVRMLETTGFAVQQIRTHRLPLAFGAWVARTQTPPVQVAALRALQQSASQEVRAYFELQEDGSFSADTGVFAAVKR